MRVLAAGLIAFALASGQQNQERRIAVRQGGAVESLQELATILRHVAEVGDVHVDEAARLLTLRGGAEQLDLAEWLAGELDRPADGPQAAKRAGVGVFRVSHAAGRQDLQEIATVVRSIGEIRMLFTYNATGAVAVRGTSANLDMAEWVMQELDKPAGKFHHAASADFKAGGSGEDLIRVFQLAEAATIRDLQEIAVAMRALGDIRFVFTYNAPRLIALRGTADQLALSQWLFDQLDQRGAGSGKREYRVAGNGEDLVRIFTLDQADPRRLQAAAVEVRNAAAIRRVLVVNTPHAIVLRGEAARMAQAEAVLERHGR